MGAIYSLRCSTCGYSSSLMLGVGFMYPAVFADTQEAAKSGELGATLKRFFTEHPDGVVDPEYVPAQCEKCGEYVDVVSLDMYIPRKGKQETKSMRRWSVAMPFENAEYVAPGEINERYDFFKEFPHRCGSCHGKVKILRDVNLEKLKCPHCADRFLELSETACWD